MRVLILSGVGVKWSTMGNKILYIYLVYTKTVDSVFRAL